MIKGVLFDKDGTLVEFSSMWIECTYRLIDTLVKEFSHPNRLKEIARLIGLDGNHVEEDSLFASGTTAELAEVFADVLNIDKKQIHERINRFYYENAAIGESVRPIGDIPARFAQLKERGLKIGVVTADNDDVTEFTIKKLSIGDYVDFVATADCYRPKPDAEAMEAFCNRFHLQRNEVIHIGDTAVDMEFAKHGLFGVGVLSGVSSEQTLRKYTPYVIPSVHHLFNQEGKFLFEGK